MSADLFSEAPLPLRAVLAQYEAETDWGRRRSRLSDAYEWIIKWHAALAYADWRRAQTPSPEVQALLARAFKVPSTGSWMQLHRTLLNQNVDWWAPWAEWDLLQDADRAHNGVSIRNRHSHLGTMPEAVCEADARALEALLRDLASSRTLTLVAPRPGALATEGGAYLRAVAESPGREPLDLWPFAYYEPSPSESPSRRFYFYQDVQKRRRVHLLHYAVPATATEAGGRHDRALFPPLRDRLFPEWEGGDPLDQALDDLTESFVGRDDVLGDLLTFGREGKGTRLVTGPPGIGKSALLAELVKRARVEENGPHVLHDFLGKGPARVSSTPSEFLRRLADGLDRLSDHRHPNGATVEERWRGIEERLAVLDAAPPPGGVLLVVDGLDEAPEVADYVPRDRPWLRVVASGRWVPAVTEFFESRHRERRERLDLPALPEAGARALLAQVVNRYNAKFDPYVAEVLRVSEGNALYIKLLCAGLAEGDYEFDGSLPLPLKIGELYGKAVERVEGENGDAYRVLQVLAAARSPLAARTVAHVLGLSGPAAKRALDGAAELTRQSGDLWSLCHETLRAWLADEFGDDAERADQDLAALAKRWAGERGPTRTYLLRHGAAHLTGVGDLDGLWSLLRDEDRRTERIEHEGYGGGAVDTLRKSVGVFVADGQYARAAWCALRAGELGYDPSATVAPLVRLLSHPDGDPAVSTAVVCDMVRNLLPGVAARAAAPLVLLGLEAQAALSPPDRSPVLLEALIGALAVEVAGGEWGSGGGPRTFYEVAWERRGGYKSGPWLDPWALLSAQAAVRWTQVFPEEPVPGLLHGRALERARHAGAALLLAPCPVAWTPSLSGLIAPLTGSSELSPNEDRDGPTTASQETCRDVAFACIAVLRAGGDPSLWISDIADASVRASVAGAVSAHARRRGMVEEAERAGAIAIEAAAPRFVGDQWADDVVESVLRRRVDGGESVAEVIEEWAASETAGARDAAARVVAWVAEAEAQAQTWSDRAEVGFDVVDGAPDFRDAVLWWRRAELVGADVAASFGETVQRIDQALSLSSLISEEGRLAHLLASCEGPVSLAIEGLRQGHRSGAIRPPVPTPLGNGSDRLSLASEWVGRANRWTGPISLARAVWDDALFRPADDVVGLWAVTAGAFDQVNAADPSGWVERGVLGLAACVVVPSAALGVWGQGLRRVDDSGLFSEEDAELTRDVLGLADTVGRGERVRPADIESLLVGLTPPIQFDPPEWEAPTWSAPQTPTPTTRPNLLEVPDPQREIKGTVRGGEVTLPPHLVSALARGVWADALRSARRSDPIHQAVALRAVCQALSVAGKPRRGFWIAAAIVRVRGAWATEAQWARADAFRDVARAAGVERLSVWITELLRTETFGERERDLVRDGTAALVAEGRVDLADDLLRRVVAQHAAADDARAVAGRAAVGLGLASRLSSYDIASAASWLIHVLGSHVEPYRARGGEDLGSEDATWRVASDAASVGALGVVADLLPYLSPPSRGCLEARLSIHADATEDIVDLNSLEQIAQAFPDVEEKERWVQTGDVVRDGHIAASASDRDSLLTHVATARARLREPHEKVVRTLSSVRDRWRGEAFSDVICTWSEVGDPDGSAETVAGLVAEGALDVGTLDYPRLVQTVIESAPRVAHRLLPLVGPSRERADIGFDIVPELVRKGWTAEARALLLESNRLQALSEGTSSNSTPPEPSVSRVEAHNSVFEAMLLSGSVQQSSEALACHPDRQEALEVLGGVADRLAPGVLEWASRAVLDLGPRGRVESYYVSRAVRQIAAALSSREEETDLVDAILSIPDGRDRDLLLRGLSEGILASHPSPVASVARTLEGAASWQSAINAVWCLRDALEREDDTDGLSDLIRTCATLDTFE